MRKYLAPVATRYFAILVQFLLVTIVTRALSQDDAGQYFMLMGIVFATYFVAGFGLPDGLVAYGPVIAAKGRAEDADALISVGFRHSLTAVPVGAAVAGLAAYLYAGGVVTAMLIAVWWAAYGAIFISGQTLVARGHSSLGTAMAYSAASAGAIVVSVPLIVFARLDRLNSVLGAIVMATVLAALVCLVVTRRMGGPRPPRRVRIGQAWRRGAVIAAGRVVQSCLLWSPVWVAGLLLGPADAATVGLASRLVSAVAAVIATVRFSVRPALARDAARGDWAAIEIYSSRIAFFATALALSAMGLFLLIGDSAVAAVFGADYRATGAITALMLIGTVGESFAGPVDEILRMAGHAGEVFRAQTVALVAGVVAQVLASATAGVNGLTVAYGLTFVALYAILDARLRRLYGIVVMPWPRSVAGKEAAEPNGKAVT